TSSRAPTRCIAKAMLPSPVSGRSSEGKDRLARVESSVSQFVGSIPEFYDRFLGPVIFDSYAADLAARIAGSRPGDVLEIACGTGIATRKIREALPSRTRLT